MTRQWRAGDAQDILHAPFHGVQVDEREGEVPVRRAAEGGVRLGHGGLHSEAGGSVRQSHASTVGGVIADSSLERGGRLPVALRFV
jgi:hypothetical protein